MAAQQEAFQRQLLELGARETRLLSQVALLAPDVALTTRQFWCWGAGGICCAAF